MTGKREGKPDFDFSRFHRKVDLSPRTAIDLAYESGLKSLHQDSVDWSVEHLRLELEKFLAVENDLVAALHDDLTIRQLVLRLRLEYNAGHIDAVTNRLINNSTHNCKNNT